jgi:response regulator RpfG family c-di-GMP phosphodiesterase
MGCKERIIKILYVDDAIDDFLIFRYQMAQTGFASVAWFVPQRDSRELIAYLNKHKENLPDAILVDVRLPLIEGVEVIRAIHCHAEYKGIPVILISGWDMYLQFTRDRYPDVGADGYLCKPINLKTLKDTLKPLTCVEDAA